MKHSAPLRTPGQIFSSLSVAALLLLTGCGIGPAAAPSPAAGVALHGHIYGGQQPVDGAFIQLYAVGNSGNGSTATPLIKSVHQSVGGAFSITGDYTCPSANSATPVYLTATGGNPGLAPGTDNPALALVAALGPCDQLLANAATTYITINEATTAAAAWALAPFATSLTHIGASSTNLAGITQAFAIAAQLADTSLGTSPNASVASYTSMESAKLYSLANVLATCVNSSGSDGTCSTVFTDVTPAGNTKPSDTFAAALDVVQNPTNNVSKIFKLGSSTPPFVGLASAPNDWTLTITYSEAGDGTGPLTGAIISTIDQQGNLWGSMPDGGTILKFSPQLAPLVNLSLYNLANSNTFPFFDDLGAKTGVMSIDPTGNLWVASTLTDSDTVPGPIILPEGSVLEFDNDGNLLSTANGYTNGGIVNPWMAMADTNGNVWIGNYGYYDDQGGTFYTLGGDVSLLTSTGAAESPGTGWNVSLGFQPGLINFDSYHNAWVTNTVTPQLLEFPPLTNGAGISNATPATILGIRGTPLDIVFDTQNHGWFSMPGAGSVGEVLPNGTLGTAITGSGLINPSTLAIDASNRLWVRNLNFSSNGGSSTNGSVCPLLTLSVFSVGSGGGAALSPIALGSDIAGCAIYQYGPGFLIDNAGSILVDSNYTQSSYNAGNGSLSGYAGLTRFVGLATPTKTPNTGPPQAP